MATLTKIVTSIQNILQDAAYTIPYLIDSVNDAVANIAAGVRMPNGEISPPLPDLYTSDSVLTTVLPYTSLPSNYQRSVFMVYDSTNYQILPPRGGDYYAYAKFLKQVNQMNLSEGGEVYRVCAKGTRLYYQGIPTTASSLGLHYYRKPINMVLDEDVPDAFISCDHLSLSLCKHYVLKEIYGEKIEAGVSEPAAAMKYHTSKFFEDMQDLVDFIGRDSEPLYYGESGYEDRGIVDG